MGLHTHDAHMMQNTWRFGTIDSSWVQEGTLKVNRLVVNSETAL